jgi:hypothetical protein
MSSSGHAGFESDPTAVSTHDLNHHHAMVRWKESAGDQARRPRSWPVTPEKLRRYGYCVTVTLAVAVN